MGVKMSDTGSRRTEVHILLASSGFSRPSVQTPTFLEETDSTWQFVVGDWDGDGIPDLVGIKKSSTGSHKTEVHILSGASLFGKPIVQTPTFFGETDDTWQFAVGDWDGDGKFDLIGIKKSNTGSHKTEVHILSGASTFSKPILQTPTFFDETDDTWQFAVGDWDGDGKLDLIGIKKSNTGSHKTEVHILSGASTFSKPILQTPTFFDETDDTWQFVVGDWDGDRKFDLMGIKKSNTGSRKTEVHVLSGASTFSKPIVQTATFFDETGTNWMFALVPPVTVTRVFYVSKECGDFGGGLYGPGHPIDTAEVVSLPAYTQYESYRIAETTGNGPHSHKECVANGNLHITLSLSQHNECFQIPILGWHGPHTWIGVQATLIGHVAANPTPPPGSCPTPNPPTSPTFKCHGSGSIVTFGSGPLNNLWGSVTVINKRSGQVSTRQLDPTSTAGAAAVAVDYGCADIGVKCGLQGFSGVKLCGGPKDWQPNTAGFVVSQSDFSND